MPEARVEAKSNIAGSAATNHAAARSPGRPRDDGLQSRRREEIIEAASRVFAERGYRATDLNQVAEVLGVAKGTIYNYFASKVELFLACVEYGKNGFYQAHQTAVAQASDLGAVEQIRRAMCAYFQFFDQNPQHIELMMQARGEFKDNSLAEVKKAFDGLNEKDGQVFPPLMQLLEQGVAQGTIKPLSIKGMHDALLNLVVGAIFSKHYGQTTDSLSAQTADILEIVFAGIEQRTGQENRADLKNTDLKK